jgi:hypothetical protein
MAKTTPTLAHDLEALLHTIRCIAQHEDELCTLLHEAKRTGRINATLRKDLQAILAKLPAQDYLEDLQTIERELQTDTIHSAA